MLLPTVEPISRRESSKAGRRDRIVNATCELLREVGIEETSLDLIAKRAAVSRGTLFNLFGSKGAILNELSDRDLRGYEALVAAEPSEDSLARIFDGLQVARKLYEADPRFYKATLWRRATGPGDESYAAQRDPKTAFWRRMLEAAETDGFLALNGEAGSVAVLLIQVATGVLSDWVSGVISTERLHFETTFGFAAVLQSFATKTSKERLKRYLRESLAELRADRRQPADLRRG
jgi:AcrR family transcriptional regulator